MPLKFLQNSQKLKNKKLLQIFDKRLILQISKLLEKEEMDIIICKSLSNIVNAIFND